MVVTETTSSNNTKWIRWNGTIQEVLDGMSNQGLTANKVIYWSDDNTDAVAVGCRQQ